MNFIVIKESETRIRIMSPEGLNNRYATFEYQVSTSTDTAALDAVCLVVTPTGKGVDRISFVRVPVFKETSSDEELANIVLTHLNHRGFDLDKIDAVVYEEALDTDAISAKAVQNGYYDEYAGIVIEK